VYEGLVLFVYLVLVVLLYCASTVKSTLEPATKVWIVVGIVTCCGLDSLGIDSWWEQDFLHPSRLALGLTHPPTRWILGLFPGVKWPGHGINHSPSSSTEYKGKVVLSLCSPCGSVLLVTEIKWPGHDVDPSLPSSVVELRLYFPCLLAWCGQRRLYVFQYVDNFRNCAPSSAECNVVCETNVSNKGQYQYRITSFWMLIFFRLQF